MLFLFTGIDREKARAALNAEVEKRAKKGTRIVRITDVHSVNDLRSALRGAGMFDETRIVVLDSILENEEMHTVFFDALPALTKSSEHVFMLEGKLDAETRKRVEKYAESAKKFDAAGSARGGSSFGGKDGGIFGLANALRRGDKKALWIGYQKELAGDKAPEAIHGVLFWGAKDMFVKSRDEKSRARAKKLIAELAELPHEARRRGEDLEYALERFVLSGL